MPNFGVKEDRYEKLVRKANFVHVKHYLKPVLVMRFNHKKVGLSEKNFEMFKKPLNFLSPKPNVGVKERKYEKLLGKKKTVNPRCYQDLMLVFI